jgi:nitroreductase
MQLDEAVRGRRSIRKYRAQSVPDSVIDALADLARHAPSSMNGQPWSFTVVRDADLKRRLAEIKNQYCPAEKRDFRADFLIGAAAVIVISVDRAASHDRAVENGVLAAATLMLAAHASGLGTVYMSAYRDDEPAVAEAVRQLLGMPGDVLPISILPLGYPDEVPPAKAMRPLREVVFHERYGVR